MSTGTNKQRITTNNGIISENNTDLANLKTRINALPTSGDTTATAEDIALGKTAVSKGVKLTGTMQPGIDTSDATVLSQDMAYGRTAYARGELITGTAWFVDTPNWKQLGYDDVPADLIADFNYSKNKLDNWNPQNIYDCANDTTLKYLPVLDLSLYDGYSGVFSGCTNLTTVSHLILNETVYIVDDMFANCPSLSNESLRNIITMLSAENMQHVYIKTLKRMGLSAEQAAICETFDEWALAVEQGWSTGYES